MENETSVVEIDQPKTVAQIKANINLIHDVLKSAMQDGTHYGKIPGCGDKPALLKPGAELIMATFRLCADPETEDLSTYDERRYRVKVRMHTPSGQFVGAGIGEASTNEEKYKWRKPVCQEEFDSTPEDRRRIKWGKSYQKTAYSIQQVRTNPEDLANTVLKMGKKRALIDAVLTATAASDIFTQEGEPGEDGTGENGKAPLKEPKKKSDQKAEKTEKEDKADIKPKDGTAFISGAQKNMLEALISKCALSRDEIKKLLGVASLNDLKMGQMNDALKLINDNKMREPGSDDE